MLLCIALFAAWRISRGGGSSAVSELSKANEVLTKANHAKESLLSEKDRNIRLLEDQLAELRTRADFGASISLAFDAHEKRANIRHDETERRAEARFDKQLGILDLLAKEFARLAESIGKETE